MASSPHSDSELIKLVPRQECKHRIKDQEPGWMDDWMGKEAELQMDQYHMRSSDKHAAISMPGH